MHLKALELQPKLLREGEEFSLISVFSPCVDPVEVVFGLSDLFPIHLASQSCIIYVYTVTISSVIVITIAL